MYIVVVVVVILPDKYAFERDKEEELQKILQTKQG